MSWNGAIFSSVAITIFMLLTSTNSADFGLSRCLPASRQLRPEYHLTKPCATSTMRTVVVSNETEVEDCTRLARTRNAFAFAFTNYTEEENVTTGSTCMVYECPEYHGFLTSTNSPSLYNYYSMYSKPLPNENYTCVPGIGIFDVVTDHMNFSNAMEACEEVGGHLANIVSETRTSTLSALVSSTLTNYTTRNRKAFVGLFFDENFVTIMGELLTCLPYRAWAPGHPKARKVEKDCVVITSNRYWETENCSKKLPYVCELTADGPMTAVERYCATIGNPKRRKNCIVRNRKHFEQIKQKEQQCNVNANNSNNL